MSNGARFVDLQVFFQGGGLESEQCKDVNVALASTYEPIRLWIREQGVRAPFRKLLVTLVDDSTHSKWHGNVGLAIGICEVTEAVRSSDLPRNARDHRWVLRILMNALERVYVETRWRWGELEDLLVATIGKPLPIVHRFAKLSQTDRSSGTKCDLLLLASPDRFQIVVRLSSGGAAERNVEVLSKDGPIFLEDDFPVKKAAIREANYVLTDKAGVVLARVPLA